MSTKYYIDSVNYDEDSQILEIEWTIDVVWRFYEVPKSEYYALIIASDKEAYYRNCIMGKFSGRQKWRSLKELLSITAEILLIEDTEVGVNTKGVSDEISIHIATTWGDLDAVKLLVENGSEVDGPGDLDCTPLYNAVSFKHLEVVRFLLENGANPDSNNDLGYTPRELASQTGGNLELLFEACPRHA